MEGAQEHLWVTLPAPRPRDPGLKLLLWDRTWASVWGSERAPGGPCLTPTSRFPVTLWNKFQVDSHPKTPVANSPGCWRAVRSQRATNRTAPLGGSGSLPVSPARDSPKRQRGRPRRWVARAPHPPRCPPPAPDPIGLSASPKGLARPMLLWLRRALGLLLGRRKPACARMAGPGHHVIPAHGQQLLP